MRSAVLPVAFVLLRAFARLLVERIRDAGRSLRHLITESVPDVACAVWGSCTLAACHLPTTTVVCALKKTQRLMEYGVLSFVGAWRCEASV